MLRPCLLLITLVLHHQQSEAFLEKLLGLDGRCSCPCRTVTVTRCIETYHHNCDHHHGGDHHDRDLQDSDNCYMERLVTQKNVTETECQVCRHYQETEMADSFRWSCDPVFDERCKTVYKQSCHYRRVCPHYSGEDDQCRSGLSIKMRSVDC